MNRIRKYITQVVGEEDEIMDVEVIDNTFTQTYLSQFDSIDRQTIDVMVDNGYQTKETLLAFDIKEDLPLLPVLNMAQKSLLRKVLTQLHQNQDFESKINDLIGGEDFNSKSNSNEMKRKRDSLASHPTHSPPKKYRTIARFEDGLSSPISQMIRRRKAIRDSDDDHTYGSTAGKLYISSNDEESDEEEDNSVVVESKRLRGRPKTSLVPTPTPPQISPKVTRNSTVNNNRTNRTPNSRLSTTRVDPSIVKSETVAKSPVNAYIPTPTELEVRERLAQKQANAKQKTGRKRR